MKAPGFIEKNDNRRVRFIIDVSRTSGLDNAKNNLALTIKHKTDNIIGIGLAVRKPKVLQKSSAMYLMPQKKRI